jgi:hypothetical protein
MSRFDSTNLTMKLGDILKTSSHSTHATDINFQASMADAIPIWELLGITEEQYHVRYPPVDLSGNKIVTGPTGPTEPVDTAGLTGLTGPTGATGFSLFPFF